MRVFNFRCWNIIDRIMINNVVGFVIDPNKQRFRYYRLDANQPDGIATKVMDRTDIIIMQSTGLNDKNGFEIFEGDIIIDNSGEVETVVYLAETIEISHGRGTVGGAFDFGSCYDLGVIEVIGNIYETPEKK